MLARGEVATTQLSRLSTICAAMEAKELRELTVVQDGRRQEDAMIRMKAAGV